MLRIVLSIPDDILWLEFTPAAEALYEATHRIIREECFKDTEGSGERQGMGDRIKEVGLGLRPRRFEIDLNMLHKQLI